MGPTRWTSMNIRNYPSPPLWKLPNISVEDFIYFGGDGLFPIRLLLGWQRLDPPRPSKVVDVPAAGQDLLLDAGVVGVRVAGAGAVAAWATVAIPSRMPVLVAVPAAASISPVACSAVIAAAAAAVALFLTLFLFLFRPVAGGMRIAGSRGFIRGR